MRIPSVSTDIPLDKIATSTTQARQRDTKVTLDDDLTRSIQKYGLLQPVMVKQIEDDKYELVIGQRRFNAHQELNLSTIKAHVLDQSIDDDEAKALSLAENVARKEMKKADLIDTVELFMEKYNSTAIVAEELGLSPATIRTYITIARLPPEIREDINNKKYNSTHALKALQALGDDEATVDIDTLRETSLEMQKLSTPGRAKYIQIKKQEPGLSPSEAATKAKALTRTHKIQLTVTDTQLERISAYQEREEIKTEDEATSNIVDLGLTAADV